MSFFCLEATIVLASKILYKMSCLSLLAGMLTLKKKSNVHLLCHFQNNSEMQCYHEPDLEFFQWGTCNRSSLVANTSEIIGVYICTFAFVQQTLEKYLCLYDSYFMFYVYCRVLSQFPISNWTLWDCYY